MIYLCDVYRLASVLMSTALSHCDGDSFFFPRPEWSYNTGVYGHDVVIFCVVYLSNRTDRRTSHVISFVVY